VFSIFIFQDFQSLQAQYLMYNLYQHLRDISCDAMCDHVPICSQKLNVIISQWE